mgnify:CR=1 FL=1
MKTIAWCTSHYKNTFAKEKAKELRAFGYNVKLGSYVKEDGNTYCKIYIIIDFNYHVLKILDSIKTSVKYGKQDIAEVISRYKDRIKELCREYKKTLKIEYEQSTNTLYAITNDKEYKISLD